jgi:hypothetical protein
MPNDYIPVKYLRNADERATGSISFFDDDREAIPIGGTGAVTEDEFLNLQASGLVLEVLEGDEAKQVLQDARTPEPEQDLYSLDNKTLREIASDEGADITGKTKNSDIADAIVENRQQTGAESLPATATRTPGATVTGPGAGGAAGPGGAAAAPGASGGGPAT